MGARVVIPPENGPPRVRRYDRKQGPGTKNPHFTGGCAAASLNPGQWQGSLTPAGSTVVSQGIAWACPGCFLPFVIIILIPNRDKGTGAPVRATGCGPPVTLDEVTKRVCVRQVLFKRNRPGVINPVIVRHKPGLPAVSPNFEPTGPGVCRPYVADKYGGTRVNYF